MGRTITGKLRELLADVNWTEIIDHMRLDHGAVLDGDWLDSWHAAADHACDAIDAVHANLERENESLRRELDRVLGEQEDRDGWVRLPVDADGVPWHIGDVTESGQEVKAMGLNRHGWSFVGIVNEIDPAIHHHHAPTVEDVLREFGKAWVEWEDGSPYDPIAKFAAKLRLAGDAS